MTIFNYKARWYRLLMKVYFYMFPRLLNSRGSHKYPRLQLSRAFIYLFIDVLSYKVPIRVRNTNNTPETEKQKRKM